MPGLLRSFSATMGMSEMRYRRFLAWSSLAGVIWSTYTCVLAYNTGTALAELPLASVVISSLVTAVVLAVILRRHPEAAAQDRLSGRVGNARGLAIVDVRRRWPTICA